MKFMSSFQCLMGGNAVQFKDYTQSQSSALVVEDNNDDKTSSSTSLSNKAKKTKTKTKTKKKKKDKKVIKVFKPDGEINLYHKSIRVSELMTEEHMVCRSDSFYIGHKIPPLPQNERLQPGHTYFLLPTHFFQSVLSFLTIASFTSSSKQQDMSDIEANNANMKMKAAFLKKAAASSCSPFDIQKTPSGTLRIRVSELFISQMMMDQAATKDTNNNGKGLLELEGAVVDLLCTTPHLHREYKQLVVGSRRIWKPKLEMIKESPLKGKRKVKMLLSASISRMKKKMKKSKSIDVPKKSSSSSSSVPEKSSSSSSSSSTSSKKKKKKKSKKSLKPVVVSLSPSSSFQKSNKFSKRPHNNLHEK